MTCKHCCGADQFFDLPSAEKEIKKYRKKGPVGATKKLLNVLDQFHVEKASLLDIGGGIGAIQWYFHSHQAVATTDVDASGGYLQIARQYARENGWEENSNFLQGDFSDVAAQVPPHDFVSLDKVICCYPDYTKLLGQAIAKSKKVLVLSFPIGGIAPRIMAWFAGLYFRWQNISFRPYIHSPAAVLEFIESRGMKRVHRCRSFPWNIWVFEQSK